MFPLLWLSRRARQRRPAQRHLPRPTTTQPQTAAHHRERLNPMNIYIPHLGKSVPIDELPDWMRRDIERPTSERVAKAERIINQATYENTPMPAMAITNQLLSPTAAEVPQRITTMSTATFTQADESRLWELSKIITTGVFTEA